MATQIRDHVERLREKPEHVRHQIAMGVAVGITGLVAVGWMTALATSGTLALKTENKAPQGESFAESIKEPASAISNLVGGVGAAFGATSTEAALSIIETRTSSTLDSKAKPANDTDKTVIPF